MQLSSVVIALAFAAFANAGVLTDKLGSGVSKSTYASSDPLPGLTFLLDNFPTVPSPDSCPGNVCYCDENSKMDDDGAWTIIQGRAQLNTQHDGEGFGLHLVNVSEHLTTGGMSVAEVETEFNAKLTTMENFDWFMDYNVGVYTAQLDQYMTNFDSQGVPYLANTWTDGSGTNWYGLFVQVPNTQMIMELMSNSSTLLSPRRHLLHRMEQRMSDKLISELGSITNDIFTPVSVNRAASDAASLESFYVDGMQTKITQSIDSDTVTRRCFRWTSATVDVCFTTRPDSTTAGDFRPADFESMLNTVHANLLAGQPNCGLDQWTDNHYAIDLPAHTDTRYVVDFLEANPDVNYYCMAGELHYVVDPTGWSFQTNFIVPTQPSGCVASTADDDWVNPACNPGVCNE